MKAKASLARISVVTYSLLKVHVVRFFCRFIKPLQEAIMQISFQFLVDLIKTMDQHPIGAALFVTALAICSVAWVAYALLSAR